MVHTNRHRGRHESEYELIDTGIFDQNRYFDADEFYASVIPPSLDPDTASVMRQALAGMLWSKQFYYFDVNRWLEERGCDPFRP